MREIRYKVFRLKKDKETFVTDKYAFDIYEAIHGLVMREEADKYKPIVMTDEYADVKLCWQSEGRKVEKLYRIRRTNDTREYSIHDAESDGRWFDLVYDEDWERQMRQHYGI